MSMLLDGASVFLMNCQLTTGILVLIIIIYIPTRPCLQSDREPASTSMGIFLACFIVASILLRLAFVSKAIFPSYFDSAQHYAIIKNIIANGPSWIFASLGSNYYHMGFHSITAFFASIFQAEITTTMLILGQVMLAVLPLPFFFIVSDVTRSNMAGIFAMTLSAFGWYMPAHAVDWGKYPALMSLGMILFVLYLAKDLLHRQKRMMLYGILGFSVLVAAFVHSRSVIVLGIVGIAWMLSMWWRKLFQLQKRLIFFFLLVIVIIESVVIQRHGVLSLLFDPYLNKGLAATLLVVFLSALAYKSFPQLTFISVLAMSLLLGSLFIPVADVIPGHTQLTLLDRPYVEIVLFVPLSLLGGLGLASLEKRITSAFQRNAVLTGIGLILIYLLVNYEYYPSDCCVIVGNDDVAAIAWIENQLSVDARIGIASTELRVVAANVFEGDVGGDAGIWITPLIERRTVPLSYDSEFDQQEVLDLLCAKKIEYLFVGELGQTFDVERLGIRPTWYRPLLSISGTRVYEVVGCK